MPHDDGVMLTGSNPADKSAAVLSLKILFLRHQNIGVGVHLHVVGCPFSHKVIRHGIQGLVYCSQPFHFIAKADSGVGFASTNFMCHQQITVTVKTMGDYIALVLSELDTLRHIRHEKIVTAVFTGADVVETVIVELCQACSTLRVGKQPAFKGHLDFRLFFTG